MNRVVVKTSTGCVCYDDVTRLEFCPDSVFCSAHFFIFQDTKVTAILLREIENLLVD